MIFALQRHAWMQCTNIHKDRYYILCRYNLFSWICVHKSLNFSVKTHDFWDYFRILICPKYFTIRKLSFSVSPLKCIPFFFLQKKKWTTVYRGFRNGVLGKSKEFDSSLKGKPLTHRINNDSPPFSPGEKKRVGRKLFYCEDGGFYQYHFLKTKK